MISSAAICRADYYTQDVQVSFDRNNRLTDVRTQVKTNETSVVDTWISEIQIPALFDAVMNASSSGVLTTPDSENGHRFLDLAVLPLQQGISNIPEPYLKWLMDPEKLIKRVQACFRGIGVQFSAKNLLKPRNLKQNGKIHYQAGRVHVKKGPAILWQVF